VAAEGEEWTRWGPGQNGRFGGGFLDWVISVSALLGIAGGPEEGGDRGRDNRCGFSFAFRRLGRQVSLARGRRPFKGEAAGPSHDLVTYTLLK